MNDNDNILSQKIGLWCSWIFAALTAIGWLGIAHFYAPAPADLGIEATKLWFSQTHHWGTIVGCTIFYIACGVLVPASVQFGLMLAKIEGRRPLWSITVTVCGIFISLIVFLNACAWIVAAYRPETSADVIQSWSDWAWMAFLLGWIYLAVEMFATGVVELMDRRPQPMVPRWLTWFTFAGAASLITAMGPAFFQSGLFSYHGLLGFYVPMAVWGTYLLLTSWYMLKELERERAPATQPAAAGAGLMGAAAAR